MGHLDEYFNKLGYTKYHMWYIFFFHILFIGDGCELIIVQIILPCITKDWKLSSLEKTIVTSAVSFGFLVSSYFTTKWSDIYGRKLFLITGNACIFVFGFLSYLAPK